MKMPDVNILVYAHDSASPFHARAHRWWIEALEDRAEPVGIAPAAAMGFVRLITNPKLFQNPLPVAHACRLVNSWLAAGAVWLSPEHDHFETVGRLLTDSHAGLNLLTDAHLAALAIEHRATLYSNDRDFTRFTGLKVKNPVD